MSFICFRDLNEDPRTIRKRVEKDKITDKDWVTFKQNPARFTQVGFDQLRGIKIKYLFHKLYGELSFREQLNLEGLELVNQIADGIRK